MAVLLVCGSYFSCCNVLQISEIVAKSNFNIICREVLWTTWSSLLRRLYCIKDQDGLTQEMSNKF